MNRTYLRRRRSLGAANRDLDNTRLAGTRPALPLPHERDENAREQEHQDIDSRIAQAEDDLRQGKRDTEARGTATTRFNKRWEGGRRR
jgi:hypothetical protein